MVRGNIADVIKALEEIGENLVNCFSNNEMKLNTKFKWATSKRWPCLYPSPKFTETCSWNV